MRLLSNEIIGQIERLERDISAANPQELLVLQPEFHSFLRDLSGKGYEIPARLRNLDKDLEDDAVESQFDNLPI
ncbi:MAG: hypothetical protein Q9M48_10540 [Rhodobacterales bacterium]|nr:hypothetical protein [Rhodobacterales bacterium]